MKNRFIINIILAFLFVFIALWYNKNQNKKVNEIFQMLDNEYQSLDFSDSIDTRVINIYRPPMLRINPNIVYITDTNNKKIIIIADNSESIDPVNMDDFIKIGDNIKKKSDSDILLIRGIIKIKLHIKK